MNSLMMLKQNYGLLDPIIREEIVGTADVLEVFNSPKFGQVAGCVVVEGTVLRNKPVRVLRDDIVIFQGELDSLRRFKDDVNEVKNGTECGMVSKIIKIFEREIRLRYLIGKKNLNQFKLICP